MQTRAVLGSFDVSTDANNGTITVTLGFRDPSHVAWYYYLSENGGSNVHKQSSWSTNYERTFTGLTPGTYAVNVRGSSEYENSGADVSYVYTNPGGYQGSYSVKLSAPTQEYTLTCYHMFEVSDTDSGSDLEIDGIQYKRNTDISASYKITDGTYVNPAIYRYSVDPLYWEYNSARNGSEQIISNSFPMRSNTTLYYLYDRKAYSLTTRSYPTNVVSYAPMYQGEFVKWGYHKTITKTNVADGYTWKGFYKNSHDGKLLSAESSYTVGGTTGMPVEDIIVYLVAEEAKCVFSHRANNAAYGTTSSLTASGDQKPGTKVAITATANRGYRFSHWELWDSSNDTSPTYLSDSENYAGFLPSGTAIYVAVFVPRTRYTLTLTADAYTTINTVSADDTDLLGSNFAGSTQTFSVYDDETVLVNCSTTSLGYSFFGWCDSATSTSPIETSTSYEFVVAKSLALYAVSKKQITVKTGIHKDSTASMFSSLSPSADGDVVAHGSEVTWSATVASNHEFIGWFAEQDGETALSTSTSYAKIVKEDTTLYVKAKSIRTYFTWASDDLQASKPADNPISKGAPIASYLKAKRWSNLQQNVNLVRTLKGHGSASFTGVNAGTELTAALYNEVLKAICDMSSAYVYDDLEVTAKKTKITAESFNVLQRMLNGIST